MSDYESRLSTGQLPDLGDYESVTQQKIDQLADLANTIEQGYKGMGATTAGQGGLPQIRNAQEYNALPPGDYIDPNGVKRTKR
jgi:hypothetical protein